MTFLTINIILLFLGALISSLFILPKISGVVRFKRLMDDPNDRSSHTEATPNLGGIAFYIVLMISFYFTQTFDKTGTVMSIIPGLTILFIIGLKDDLVVLSPLSKLAAQILATLFLVFPYNINLEALHGFMGIESIPNYMAAIISVLLVVTVINAINLIDGIDGLAATVGIVIFSVFVVLFYLADQTFLKLTCVVMIGSLLAYLRFNLSKKKKIFMGDTGAMIIGFIIGLMAVRLLALDVNTLSKLPFNHENLPYVLAATLFIPLFDTARVFFIRILKRKSPFLPDRNHIHHLIIDCFQVSHRRASFCIGLANFLFVSLFTFLAMHATQWELLFVFLGVILLAIVFFFFLNKPHILHKIGVNIYKRSAQRKKLR